MKNKSLNNYIDGFLTYMTKSNHYGRLVWYIIITRQIY